MEFHSSFNNKKAQMWKLAKETNYGQSSVQCTPTWIFFRAIKSFIHRDISYNLKPKPFLLDSLPTKLNYKPVAVYFLVESLIAILELLHVLLFF
jgi:hypothetical protein